MSRRGGGVDCPSILAVRASEKEIARGKKELATPAGVKGAAKLDLI